IGVAVVVPRAPGGVSPRDRLVIDRGDANVGLLDNAGSQPEGAPLVHAGGGAEDRAMLRLDLGRGTGELDFTHGALEGLPLFALVRAEGVTAGAGAGRLSPVAKPHRVRLVGDGADGALTVYMVGHGSKSTTGFMGKVWDGWESPAAFQRWNREWVAACYRVLKPGGHIAAFGGTRTWHRLAVAIEDAGFEMRDSLAWLYGSGFPKSHDVGKAIDKRPGASQHREFGAALRAAMTAKGYTNTFDVAEVVLGRRTGAVANWIKYQFPEARWWPALRDLLDMDEARWGPVIAEAERTKVGQRNGTDLEYAPGEGRRRDATVLDITAPATPEAQQWDGWGTALKPAFEPIVLA